MRHFSGIRSRALPLLFCFAALTALSAQSVSLHLLLRDSLTGEPLAGAGIHVLPAGKSGSTDGQGRLSLHDLPAGEATVEARYVGYTSKTLRTQLPLADTLRLLLAPEGGELDAIIVQSTRTGSRVEDSPTKIEVLGREDMEEENGIKPGNVASILGDYSGIQIQSTDLATGNASVRILGLAGRYTQLLRDGLPLYGGLAGDFGILQVQPLDLQQIELVKGPASTLFGGGAIAGIVNFISKQPMQGKSEASITLNQTTLGESNADLWLAGRGKHVGATFFAAATRQDARDVDGRDGFTDLPRLRSVTIHPRAFFYFSPKSRLIAGLSYVGETRLGGDLIAVEQGASAAHPYRDDNRSARVIGDLNWQYAAGPHSTWNAKAAWSNFDRRQDLPAWRFQGQQQDWYSECSYASSKGNWSGVIGLNYSGTAFQKGRTDSLQFTDFQQDILGAFVQASWHKASKWNAEAGLRVDRGDAYGTFALPSAALLYHVSPAFSLRGGFGLGYALPNPLVDPDPTSDTELRRLLPLPASLKAERSAGGSLEWNLHKVFGEDWAIFFNQQFFYTAVRRPFVTRPDSAGQFLWANADAPVSSRGVDNYFRMTYREIEFYLGYTYALARQEYDREHPDVPLTPRHRFAAVFGLPLGEHWRAGAEASWNGRQTRADGTQTPSYLFAAGMLGWHWWKLDLVLNGENLLDYRQTRHEPVVLPPLSNPSFLPLWAPVDGRVINLSATLKW